MLEYEPLIRVREAQLWALLNLSPTVARLSSSLSKSGRRASVVTIMIGSFFATSHLDVAIVTLRKRLGTSIHNQPAS